MRRSASGSGPSFLGVGPEKTGTTWVHAQLSEPSDVWLPPEKELRYFNMVREVPGDNWLQRFSVMNDPRRSRYRAYLRRRIKHWLTHPLYPIRDTRQFRWDCDFVFREHDDDWYRTTFADRDEQVVGEVSPQYFFMTDEMVAHAASVAPEARVLVTLRHPVDWIWSFARWFARLGYIANDEQAMWRFIEQQRGRSSFATALDRWRAYFPDRVQVMFFDDLVADPWDFYCRLCTWLEIEPDQSQKPLVSKVVNPGRANNLPEGWHARIFELWADDMAQLEDRVGPLPHGWRSR
ncbi:sulfotransferase [Croceicoccus naphthovorans]|uniref:Uncharacterized protein n=1 Tax=Croceicoccus naphthovorans TaxID=1348774 RepID=A0A0G3XEY7_9SPHN|nr:sulfotransferase [Croceicoccus naphthovorans]AKM10075.1 hypothetical protein AB433_08960 [Croceicoccus naphthovorans]MBB3991205.1 hypothetical protein [Croceicoccus naphthovorans]